MGGFEYLTLIMDLHSHKIVGYHCGESLDTKTSMKALNQAIEDLPDDRYPIHHSDRGSQYCSHKYVERLNGRYLPVSMTELNHCAENSTAERLNGILKQSTASEELSSAGSRYDALSMKPSGSTTTADPT